MVARKGRVGERRKKGKTGRREYHEFQTVQHEEMMQSCHQTQQQMVMQMKLSDQFMIAI